MVNCSKIILVTDQMKWNKTHDTDQIETSIN